MHLDEGVTAEYDLSADGIQRGFEEAAWAASLRGVARDFGSASLANFACLVRGCFFWGRTFGTKIHFAADQALPILTRY